MQDTFTPDELAILAPYMTNTDKPVFAVRGLPEEVVAVLFAYYSRSREGLRRNLLNMLKDQTAPAMHVAAQEPLQAAQEKARAFHEKWVLGYGHASVAEHACVHLAVEDVSILATKVLEDARLVSFTEKSTRYVPFEAGRYLKPRAIAQSTHAQRYTRTADRLFETYRSLTPAVLDYLKSTFPRAEGVREGAHDAAIKAKACDILRYILPASTLTNLGMTLNARSLEHLVSRLTADSLEEVRTLGDALKEEGSHLLPTLLKYANPNAYRARTADAMDAAADHLFRTAEPAPVPSVSLVRSDAEADIELVAALLYPYTRVSLAQVRAQVKSLTAAQRQEVLDDALRRRGPHDAPLRAFEHIHYTFDLLVDFGAFRDIQRHRMVTQTVQPLTVEHGFEVPPELEDAGLAGVFEERMEEAAACYRAMVGSLPYEASYIVPLAFRRRVVFTWNLREVIHFIELRSAPQGHRSYRRLAQAVFRHIEAVHPQVARYIRVVLDDGGLERLQAEERTAARKEALAQKGE